MALQIRRAERKKAKLRLALLGPTGSGKTMSALKLAFGLGGPVGLIDTENGSGDLYATMGEYDVITLEPPYTVAKYREAIRAFEEAKYSVIIIDSLSHAWAGEGGLLDKSGQLEKSGAVKNSFAAWREITPEHNRLVEEMLGSPCHVIATMRVKTEYVLEPDSRGKMVPRKVGLAPVQRDGLEYEFTVVMDIAENHVAKASKDRTAMFDGWFDTISEETGRKLLAWLEVGNEPAPIPPKSNAPVPNAGADLARGHTNKEGMARDWVREMVAKYQAALTIEDVDALTGDAKVQAFLKRLGDAYPDLFETVETARIEAQDRVIDNMTVTENV